MANVITYDVTKELLNEILEATKILMLEYKGLQRSDLVNSLEWKYEDNQFVLIANDYFQYVDTGRKPRARKVPIEALIKWIKRKNIVPSNGQSINNLAYAIQTAIFRTGIVAKPYTQRIIGVTIDLLSEELATQLSVLIADEISKELTFTLGKN